MTSIHETGPHLIGLYIAVLGLGALFAWLFRRKTRDRFGSKRFLIGAFGFLLLVLTALFGSGSRTEAYTTTFSLAPLVQQFGEQRVAMAKDGALDVAFSEAFTNTYAQHRGVVRAFQPEDIRPYLKIGRNDVTYARSTNFARTLIEPSKASPQRVDFVQSLAEDHGLATLVLLSLYRSAKTDTERQQVIDWMSHSEELPAKGSWLHEWMLRDLGSFASSAGSDALRAKLEATIAMLSR